MRLYNLPPRPDKPVPIHGAFVEGKSGESEAVTILYHHADGAYSYCTIAAQDGEQQFEDGECETVHLSMSTPLYLEDGKYYIGEENT